MSSLSRDRWIALVLLIGLGACDREDRDSRGKPLAESVSSAPSPDTIWPGNASPPGDDPRAAHYEQNAAAISQGQSLYGSMNCAGCHSHGGGGMGPALMDDKWRYGARTDQIVASIAEGRPNGMPAWRGKLTEQQMWQIAAYVRSMSGQLRKDSVSARADEMSNTPPQTQLTREKIIPADTGQE